MRKQSQNILSSQMNRHFFSPVWHSTKHRMSEITNMKQHSFIQNAFIDETVTFTSFWEVKQTECRWAVLKTQINTACSPTCCGFFVVSMFSVFLWALANHTQTIHWIISLKVDSKDPDIWCWRHSFKLSYTFQTVVPHIHYSIA